MVDVFEWSGRTLFQVGQAPDLAQASAGLPHGSYTSLRTYRGNRVVRLGQHAERLSSSVGTTLRPEDLREALAGALHATAHPDSRLRVTWSPPRLFLAVEPFVALPDELYCLGAACATLQRQRERPQAKDTHFIADAAALLRSLPPGTHEGLMVAEDGSILEGLTSNFFAVAEGALRTEQARALPGITRALALEVSAAVLPVELRALRVDELPAAREAFITSVSRGVLPVTRVDGRPLGTGRPGPVTAQVARRLRDLVEREAETLEAEPRG